MKRKTTTIITITLLILIALFSCELGSTKGKEPTANENAAIIAAAKAIQASKPSSEKDYYDAIYKSRQLNDFYSWLDNQW